MASQDQTATDLSQKGQLLLDRIRKVAPDGEHVGNMFLRTKLQDDGIQWSEDDYWEAQVELSEKGLIGTGRGRGGSLWLRQPIEVSAEVIPGLVEEEEKLYQPLVDWLNEFLGHEAKERDDFYLPRITASPSGRKRETGIWSRPDVSLVQVNRFDYITMPQIEASSFEVKRYEDAVNIDSVYEAASHSRWVHSSWLVAEDSETNPRQFSDRFRTELERFGVGLMTMKKVDNKYRFTVVLDPEYRSPEPKEMDEFLQYFFMEEGGRVDQRNLRRFREKSRPG